MQPDELTHRLSWKLGDALALQRQHHTAQFPYVVITLLHGCDMETITQHEHVRKVYDMICTNSPSMKLMLTLERQWYNQMESLYSEMTWELMGAVA